MIGKTISHYRILEKLGEGGMGIVYKAEDTRLKRTAAIKFLPPELTRDNNAKKRFILEAQAASSLDHPNVCTIYEIEETTEKQTFIAMACYEGEILKDKIQKGPLKIDNAIDIAIQISQGLEKAHKKGIVHRDIKPANIFITEDSVVKILDFGLVKLTGQTKLTKTGTTLGTVNYMSPEQSEGKKVDHRSDIWSLGILLYEMITGQLPFKGDYEQAVVYSIMNEEPEPVTSLRTGVPMELERITSKALAKKPGERYQHAGDLLVDLRALIKEMESGIAKSKQISKRFPKKRTVNYGPVAILLILIGVVGYSLFLSPGKAIDSIAVLPFSNTAADPELEYLSDGMTESIINSLSKLPNLEKVIARNSVFKYKGKEIVPMEIGKELGVEAVLISHISQREDELSISVELVNTKKNSRIWGTQYRRSITEIFAIQNEISKAITENLRLKITGEDYERMTKRYTEDSDAYRIYLKGKYFYHKYTEDGLKKSVEFFQEAIQKDPEFALAYAGLGNSYYHFGWFNLIPKELAYEKGVLAALKALEIDNAIGEAHVAIGKHKLLMWDVESAENEFKKALTLNPLDADTYHEYAHTLALKGSHKESINMMEQALELEPLLISINGCLGQTFYQARQYDKAIEQLKKTIEMDPNYYHPYGWLGMAYLKKEMYDQAIEIFQKGSAAASPYKTRVIGGLGYTYAVQGKRDDALQQLDRLNDLSKEMVVDPCFIAWIYTGLGEKEIAFEWLEKGYEEKSSWMIMINADPLFDPLRSDSRFQDLLKRMHFRN